MSSASQRRQLLWCLLGRLPDRHRPIQARCIQSADTEHYRLEKLLLDLNGLEPVPAWFTIPSNPAARPPAVLYTHAHGGDYPLGKDEFIRGRRLLHAPPYAEALARNGYAGLCIDLWGFGERGGRTESSIFKDMLWRGRVLWGMMVYDTLRALDYLCARSDIDANRIAALGLSMGSTMSWWIAALDQRVRVCVDLCCLTDFDSLVARNGLDLHGLYYYVPDLLNHFTTADINELIAPRPHLAVVGEADPLTPPEGLDRVDAHLRQVYQSLGAPDAWKLSRHPGGHQETPAMREEILAWLNHWV